MVVGAGPSGSVAALLLARLGARVVLVDDPVSRAARPVVGEMLPPAARPAFERLGLARLLDDPAHAQVPGSVTAWGPGAPVTLDHIRSPLGDGVQPDRAVLDEALREAARAAGATVLHLPRSAWRTVRPTSRGPVVVDASGRSAVVVRAVGARVERVDRRVAVVGIPERTRGAGDVADGAGAGAGHPDRRVFIIAEPDGWWSMMCLPDGRSVVAFHTDADLPAARHRASATRWWTAFTAAAAPIRPGVADAWDPPAVLWTVAADSRRLAPTPSPVARVVAAGDAEMAFDPLSSFGIIGAISSAEEALPAIAAFMDGDAPVRAAHERRETARSHRWARYLERLAAAHADETRWPDSRFWARRM